MFSISLFSVIVTFFTTLAQGASLINVSAYAPEDVITKDVAIIGGGASGTYAAVRLREDLDVSVVVIEQENRLVRIVLLN